MGQRLEVAQPGTVQTIRADASVTVPVPVPLPNWTDAPSVTTYLVSLVGAVVTIIALIHPGFTEPSWLQGLIPAVGILVATGAQIFNAVTHRAARVGAAMALINQGGKVFAPAGKAVYSLEKPGGPPQPNSNNAPFASAGTKV